MRRVSQGQGKATPNIHDEPDFSVIAMQYPLIPPDEKSFDMPEKNNKISSHSDLKETNFQDNFGLADESWSWELKEDNTPLGMVGEEAAPDTDTERVSNSQRDLYFQLDSMYPPPQHEAAIINRYDGDGTNADRCKSSVQPHSYSSEYEYVAAGEGMKEEGKDQAVSSAQEIMNYDPLPVSYQHFDSHENCGHPMHTPHHECNSTNQHFGSNINQHARTSHQGPAEY
jgi:hypothetical protein